VLLTGESFEVLRLLCTERWFSIAHQKLLDPEDIRLLGGSLVPEAADKYICKVGQISTELGHLLEARIEGSPCKSITFTYDDWKIEKLIRFRPLIYFAAFGNDQIFRSLGLAIESLIEMGEYRDTVMVLTNVSRKEMGFYLPVRYLPQIRYAYMPGLDLLDFTLARYRIAEVSGAFSFQPILYLDTDIICNASVTDILVDILRSDGLCLCAELDLYNSADFYGASLFHADPTAQPREPRGLTSGLIGLPNIDAASTFSSILRTAYAHARTAGRFALPYMDQPIVNYVLHKLGGFSTDVLSSHVLNLNGNFSIPNHETPKVGFVHFCGGIGNTSAKLPAIERYYAVLRTNFSPAKNDSLRPSPAGLN
jgi:hypothetical protein